MKEIHPVQLQILKILLFAPSLKYTQIKPDKEMENNRFDFHLDKLIGEGFVTKKNNTYSLTNKGKEFANTMDSDKVKIQRQAKISCWITCTRDVDEELEFLIFTRLKHPFYGAQGFFNGKVAYGEKASDTAKRELLEETSLEGEPKLIHIRHYLVYNKETDELVEDKFFFMYRIHNPKGELISQGTEGNYEWIKESELDTRVTNYYEPKENFWEHLEIIKANGDPLTMVEVEHATDKF